MNNINKFFAGIGVLAAMVSCDGLNTTPEFQEKDSFAAFVKTSISVNENVGKLSIPVSIASINPVTTNVTYRVEDGSAKQGENFNLVDPSTVLVFDGKARELNIEFNIVDLKGTFTGDKNFKVIIESAGDINLGTNIVCEVSIKDLDHPLAALLGTWSATAPDYFAGGAQTAWSLDIMKDGKSLKSVKLSNLSAFLASKAASKDVSLAANVVFDENGEILGFNVPYGQILGFKPQGAELEFIGIEFDGMDPLDFYEEGNMEFRFVDGKLKANVGFGTFAGDGWFDIYLPGIELVKK